MPAERAELLARAAAGVKAAMLERDRLLVHCVNSIDDIHKAINLIYEQLTEWYGLAFPELKADQAQYATVALALDPSKPDRTALVSAVGEERAAEILKRLERTMGIALPEPDLAQTRALAKAELALFDQLAGLETYRDSLAKEVCPNLTYLLEAPVAAKLVAIAGGVEKLARLPASTVQVLGAEKALFRHLRTQARPPKHGVLFQHPAVNKAPKQLRGRIARALAAKVAIAAKADAYTHHFIAEKLKADFEKRLAQIRG